MRARRWMFSAPVPLLSPLLATLLALATLVVLGGCLLQPDAPPRSIQDGAIASFADGPCLGTPRYGSRVFGGGFPLPPGVVESRFLWLASRTGRTEFRTEGSTFDTVLSIYRADGVLLQTNDAGGGGTEALITREVRAGECLVIGVRPFSSAPRIGSFGVSIHAL